MKDSVGITEQKEKIPEGAKSRNNKPPKKRALQEREMARLPWMSIKWENACTLSESMRTRFIENQPIRANWSGVPTPDEEVG